MSNALKCESCGAAIQPGSHACAYCGTAIAASERQAPPPPPDPHQVRAERFHRLKQHPEYQRLLAYRPASSGPAALLVFQGVFGGIFALFAIFFMASYHQQSTWRGRNFGDLPGAAAPFDCMFYLVPGIFLLVGAGLAISAISRFMRYEQAPVRAFAARVAAKDLRESRSNNSTTITYCLTIEDEHGARQPFTVQHPVYSMAAEDDIGVAHVRDTFLLNFTKVDV